MRIAIVLAVPFVMGFGPAQAAPDTPDSAQALPLDMPGYSRPARLPSGDLDDFVRRATCSDTIEHAREASGRPPLEKHESDTPEPMLYKAVDRNVDGCDVLVMADDTDDLRPVPEGGPVVLKRADGN